MLHLTTLPGSEAEGRLRTLSTSRLLFVPLPASVLEAQGGYKLTLSLPVSVVHICMERKIVLQLKFVSTFVL